MAEFIFSDTVLCIDPNGMVAEYSGGMGHGGMIGGKGHSNMQTQERP